jgi:hypothetical protein
MYLSMVCSDHKRMRTYSRHASVGGMHATLTYCSALSCSASSRAACGRGASAGVSTGCRLVGRCALRGKAGVGAPTAPVQAARSREHGATRHATWNVMLSATRPSLSFLSASMRALSSASRRSRSLSRSLRPCARGGRLNRVLSARASRRRAERAQARRARVGGGACLHQAQTLGRLRPSSPELSAPQMQRIRPICAPRAPLLTCRSLVLTSDRPAILSSAIVAVAAAVAEQEGERLQKG